MTLKYLNRLIFEREKKDYSRPSAKYSRCADLMADRRLKFPKGQFPDENRFFASIHEDQILARKIQ